MVSERELEIPFENILPHMGMEGLVEQKCLDIIAYLTSNYFGIDVEYEYIARELALSCERFINRRKVK